MADYFLGMVIGIIFALFLIVPSCTEKYVKFLEESIIKQGWMKVDNKIYTITLDTVKTDSLNEWRNK